MRLWTLCLAVWTWPFPATVPVSVRSAFRPMISFLAVLFLQAAGAPAPPPPPRALFVISLWLRCSYFFSCFPVLIREGPHNPFSAAASLLASIFFFLRGVPSFLFSLLASLLLPSGVCVGFGAVCSGSPFTLPMILPVYLTSPISKHPRQIILNFYPI